MVHTNGQITRIPGDPTGSGRMVASTSSLTPHLVVCGKKNNKMFICDKQCPRHTSYGFFSHSIAVAEVNGNLKNYVEQITKMKCKANLSSLVYHGLPEGAGEKGVKAKIKHHRATVTDAVQNLPVVNKGIILLLHN